MKQMDSKNIIQIGIVVRNIESVAQLYSEIFSIEMPQIRQAFPNITYRGRKITTHSKLCSFNMGNVTVELIQPDQGPSSWREFLDEHGEGVHHIGVVVSDLQGAFDTLADHGINKRQYGGAQWGSYTIVNSDALGVLFNIKSSQPFEEE